MNNQILVNQFMNKNLSDPFNIKINKSEAIEPNIQSNLLAAMDNAENFQCYTKNKLSSNATQSTPVDLERNGKLGSMGESINIRSPCLTDINGQTSFKVPSANFVPSVRKAKGDVDKSNIIQNRNI